MLTTTKPKPAAPVGVPLPDPAELDSFPPSAELGRQLQTLGQEQAEIDCKKAEELARLRAIQDRD